MNESSVDQRTPSPPYGYSRPCDFSYEQQVHIVAEFHANGIRPSRIAFRMGIDIALIEALIAGEQEQPRFDALVADYRKRRFQHAMRRVARDRGVKRYDAEQRALRELQRENGE